MTQSTAEVAQLLPIWAVVALIWLNALMISTIGYLTLRIIEQRTVDAKINGLRESLTKTIDVVVDDVNIIKREVFGLDGENGLRGDGKVTRRTVGAMMVVLRRMAEAASIDTKEIDAIETE